MQIDRDNQRRRNIEHADNPQIGDRWTEMLAYSFRVDAVSPESVTIEINGEELKTMSRDEFAQWVRYKGIPGTWADILPFSRIADLDQVDR